MVDKKYKTFKDIDFRSHPRGTGFIGRIDFENGYGVSVIRFGKSDANGKTSYCSYTNSDDEWEVGVCRYGYLCEDDEWPDSYGIDKITGYLKSWEVTKMMKSIQDMKDPDFVAYPKIQRLEKLYMTVTQKIHGSNGQIFISGNEVRAGSRNRWLTTEDDNYGFAKWVSDNKDGLIEILGNGRHYGEWCGPGINAGEGLKEKTFVLFEWHKYQDRELWPYYPFLSTIIQIRTVPVLGSGRFSMQYINKIMEDLKQNGSKLVDGYMKPEGVVVDINGIKYKKVFDVEETGWSKPADKIKRAAKIERVNVDHLIQPLRLAKLLSRDEKYKREYPNSLPQIVKDYIQDLESEQQLGDDDVDLKVIRSALSGKLFYYVKEVMSELFP